MNTLLIRLTLVALFAAVFLVNARAYSWFMRALGERLEPRPAVPWSWVSVALIIVMSIALHGGASALSRTDQPRKSAEENSLPAAENVATPQNENSKSPAPAETSQDESTVDTSFIDEEQAYPFLLGIFLANLAIVPLGALVLRLFDHATVDDLGFGLDHLRSDTWLGLKTFAAVALPVYGLSALLSQWIPGKHPLETLISEHPRPGLIALMTLAACIGAPLAEEFMFRVLLQGWLERQWQVGETTHDQQTPTASVANVAVTAARPGMPVNWAPIGVSATIFALLHLGHGAAPIPLFFLALALGWLYQRTHRIWAGLVVHAALNTTSTALLAVHLTLEHWAK
jgi:membrane protease YdiL (CAAX protease family)